MYNVTADDSGKAVHIKQYYRFAACSRGFTIAWILLTICFMIINIIVFAAPEWIGDTASSRSGTLPYEPGSEGVGLVGLYKLCEYVAFGTQRVCDGAFQDFSTILTDGFRASTFFIGVSCLVIFLCILLFLLFICVPDYYVYAICGSLQIVSTVFMFLGCVIFPSGWDHVYVRRICGPDVRRYNIGKCEMRWAYILAIIGIFDILMLAVLAFVLFAKHRRRWKNVGHVKSVTGNAAKDPAKEEKRQAKGQVVTLGRPVDGSGSQAGDPMGYDPRFSGYDYDDGPQRRGGRPYPASTAGGRSQPGGQGYHGQSNGDQRDRRGSF